MADAKARREARMKRILMNSENRLKKISGRNDEESDSTCRSFLDNDDTQTQNFNQTTNGLTLGSEDIEDKAENNEERDVRTNAFTNFTSENYSNQYSDTNNWMDDTSDDGNKELNFERFSSSPKEQTELRSDIAKEVSSNRLVNRILQSSITYVTLAALVNLLIFLKLEHFYGKSIFTPFFTLSAVKLLIPGSIEDSEKGSLLVAALILCSVRPEVAYNIKWTINLIHTILTDFALYVFSFVLLYKGIMFISNEYLNVHLSEN